jgi:hypothetical protein
LWLPVDRLPFSNWKREKLFAMHLAKAKVFSCLLPLLPLACSPIIGGEHRVIAI